MPGTAPRNTPNRLWRGMVRQRFSPSFMPIQISRLDTSPVEAIGRLLAARSMISGSAKMPSTVGMSGSPSMR